MCEGSNDAADGGCDACRERWDAGDGVGLGTGLEAHPTSRPSFASGRAAARPCLLGRRAGRPVPRGGPSHAEARLTRRPISRGGPSHTEGCLIF
jgi:hypothetical protein